MASVNITIKNLPQIKAAFAQAPHEMSIELNKAIKLGMFALQGETLLNVGGSRGIKIVTRGLINAARRPPTFQMLKSVYEIDIPYGIYVHDGTSRMAARPFLDNAAQTKEDQINQYFTNALDNVLNKIARAV